MEIFSYHHCGGALCAIMDQQAKNCVNYTPLQLLLTIAELWDERLGLQLFTFQATLAGST